MNAQLITAIAKLKEKGEALGQARSEEQRLEDDRGILKELAIQRVMKRDKCAATPAEKIVESDIEYMEHRIAQRVSVVARFRADAEYHAAKGEVTYASLLSEDVILLQAANTALLHARDHYKKEATERQEANAGLVQANHDLAHQLAVANEMLAARESNLPVRSDSRFPLSSNDDTASGVAVPSEIPA